MIFLRLFFLMTFLSLFSAVFGQKEVAFSHFSKHDIPFLATQAFDDQDYLVWSLDYEAYQEAINDKAHLTIRYKTPKDINWTIVDSVSVHATKFRLQLPSTNDTYAIQIGITENGNTVYREAIAYTNRDNWGIFQWLKLIGALGLLIYGMKVLSDSTQQLSGSKLRNLLESLTSNSFKSILTGLGITALIQASAITVIMTSSFTSAGLISLRQAAGVIMGANIGTTIKGWLISMLGFDLNLYQYALILFALSFPFLFLNKSNFRSIGNLIIGLALLLLGLDFIKNTVPSLTTETPWVNFFMNYQDIPVLTTLLFVALGIVISFIIQSSSAALILSMALISNGVLSFEAGVAMILGENIGTTFTCEIAAMIGNTNAKRTVRIHTLFNLIGNLWAILALPVLMEIIAHSMVYLGWGNPITDSSNAGAIGLAFFHTLFNVVNTLLLVGFIPQLIDLAKSTVRKKHTQKKQTDLQFIGSGLVSNPALSLSEARKSIYKLANTTLNMSHLASQLVTEKDSKVQELKINQLQKLEDESDAQEKSILRYLNSISEGELSPATAKQIHILSVVAHDFERIGDTYDRIGKILHKRLNDKIWLTPNQRSNILSLFNEVNKGFELLMENIQTDKINLQEAIRIEDSINSLRNRFRKEYFQALDESDQNIKGGLLYSELFTLLEKIGDHILKITHHAKDLG